jgi:RNA polymerase sigma-70 factor (ECF subfamily)
VLFDRIYRYICARCSGAEDGKDVVACVFMRAFERLDTFDETRGSLEQWIMGMAKFALIDHWRSQTITLDIEDVDPAANDDAYRLLDEAISFEFRIRDLPDATKALLRLRYVDDMTFEEIADFLGRNPATVRSTFSRLHKKIHLTPPYEQS